MDENSPYTGQTTQLDEEDIPEDLLRPQSQKRSILGPILGVSLALVVLLAGLLLIKLLSTPSTPQSGVITVVTTPTPRSTSDADSFWSARTDWLTPADYAQLRTSSEVYNLAFLHEGTVRYSSKSISSRSQAWQPTKAPSDTEIRLFDRNFTLWANNYNYTYRLNVYQPFVLSDNPGVIYMVSQDGRFWSITTLSEDLLVNEPDVESDSPVQVPANDQLSL